jgi:hypothetical protein
MHFFPDAKKTKAIAGVSCELRVEKEAILRQHYNSRGCDKSAIKSYEIITFT